MLTLSTLMTTAKVPIDASIKIKLLLRTWVYETTSRALLTHFSYRPTFRLSVARPSSESKQAALLSEWLFSSFRHLKIFFKCLKKHLKRGSVEQTDKSIAISMQTKGGHACQHIQMSQKSLNVLNKYSKAILIIYPTNIFAAVQPTS